MQKYERNDKVSMNTVAWRSTRWQQPLVKVVVQNTHPTAAYTIHYLNHRVTHSV